MIDNPKEPQIATRQYKVFISYRHADNREQGRQWASWLHQMLETYEIPKDLIGKNNTQKEKIPERIFPVFRDEEELSADANLASSIVTALDHSEHLIIICSPRAVASEYVKEEISYFKKIGKHDNMIAMMVDGEPHSADDECFPVPLRFDIDADGTEIKSTAEPIAADFRIQHHESAKTIQGWTTPEAYRQSLEESESGRLSNKKITVLVDAYRKHHELMKLKIISGILDVPLGVLSKRDLAYQIELANNKAKVLRRWLTTVGLLAVLAIGGGAFAWLQKQEAVKQQAYATQNFSQQLTAKALEDLKESRVEEGLAGLSRSLYEWPNNQVSRDRLLFELAYRGWLVPIKHYPPFPSFDLGQIDIGKTAIESTITNGELSFSVDSTSRPEKLVLNQQISMETQSGESKRISRQLFQSQDRGNSWQSSKAIISNHEWDYGDKVTLPSGQVIENLPNGEVELGFAEIEQIDANGVIALSADKNTLAVAGFYDNDTFLDSLAIRFYDTTTLKEIEPAHRIPIPEGLDVKSMVWQNDTLALITNIPTRRFSRIDLMTVTRESKRVGHVTKQESSSVISSESSPEIKVQRIVENRIIPGKSWSLYQGKLYVHNASGITVYQPSPPMMANWSAKQYSADAWQPFSKVAEDDYSMDAWRKLTATNTKTGVSASIKTERSIELREANGKIIKTLEASTQDPIRSSEMRAIGFSPNGEMLTLISRDNPAPGETYLPWEVYHVDSGLEVFPSSNQYDSASGPPLLNDLFLPLEPLGWMANNRALAFKYYEQGSYMHENQMDESYKERKPFENYWIVDEQGKRKHFIFPVIWTDQIMPDWFLNTISKLLHVKHDAIRGLELVDTSKQSFNEMVDEIIQPYDGKQDSQEYVDFLKELKN